MTTEDTQEEVTNDSIDTSSDTSISTGEEIFNMSEEEFDAYEAKILSNIEEAPDIEETEEIDSEEGEDEEQEEPLEESSEGGEEEEDGSTEEETSSDEESNEEEEVNTEETEESTDEVVPDELKRILEPFKANGHEMQVNNVDEAITLMQKGANYNKKMASLKPHLKILKTLEKQDLLDESKLSFLIDLNKKDPKAISRLIKDSGLDPLEMDIESTDNEYKPNNYTTSDQEIELGQVMDDLKDHPSYNKTIDIVGKQWDTSSQNTIANEPEVLNVINDHVHKGYYDIIAKETNRLKALGHLQRLSDIEAYKQVGDYIQSQGGFDPQPAKKIVPPKRKNVTSDPNLNKKRKAASSTKSTVDKAKKNPFQGINPLNMSEEEFEEFDKKYASSLK